MEEQGQSEKSISTKIEFDRLKTGELLNEYGFQQMM